MFDQLFKRSHARERHLNSPLLKERLDYLRHCAEQSYKPGTLRELAQNLLRIQNLLRLATSSNAIDSGSIELAFEVLNVFDNINFNPTIFGPDNSYDDARTFQVTSAYTDASNTYDPGGRLGQLMFRFSW